MVPIRLILIGFCALLVSARGAGWSPVLDEFHRSDFQSDGMGWSAAQLPDGRLIFGFDSLVVFDGVTWRQHSIPGTYALRALAPARDGRVWLGGISQIGYVEEERGQFVYHSLMARVPAEVRSRIVDVWSAYAAGPGRAVFVTNEDVLEWDGERFTVRHLPGRSRLSSFRRGGDILIGQRPDGLARLDAPGLVPVLPSGTIAGASVVWMGDWGGSTVAATTQGLRRLGPDGATAFAPEVDAWIRDGVLTDALPLADGRLALATMRHGVMLVEPVGEGVRQFALTTGLPAETVNALFQDAEGWLWVVSPARLLRVWPDRDVSIFQPPRRDAFPARALAAVGGQAWVAADTGLWRTLDPAAAPRGRLASVAGAEDRILSVLADGDGVLFGHRAGVSRLSPDGVIQPVYSTGTDVFALARDPSGALVVAHDRRISRVEDGRVTELATGLNDVPTSVAAAPAGGVLAGTWIQGVQPFGTDDPVVHELAASFAGEPGSGFVHAHRGTLFAARGRLAAALGPEGRLVRAAPLVEGYEPRALQADGPRTAWLAGERRFGDGSRVPLLHRLVVVNGQLEATPQRLDVLSRAGAIRSLAIEPGDAGSTLWIGGDEALLRVEPSALRAATAPAPPQFRLLTVTDTEPASGLLLPHRNNRLELAITSPEPGRRPDLRLETLLVGGDNTWSEPRNLSTIELANLQSGDHALHARWVSPEGKRSGAMEFAFAVAPPWWLTSWAITLEALAAGLLVLTIVRIRVRSLRRRAVQLEKLIAERTAELVHANQAKTDFVSSMSHELRNPLNGIVASAHALEDSELPHDQRRLLVNLRHCAGLLDALIGDVLDFSEIESGRINLKVTEYDPVELLQTAAGVIEPVAARKHIGLRLDVDPTLPRRASGDPSRLQQILLNLLGNAVKFSTAGEVVVQAQLHEGAPSERRLIFRVADQGPGIAPQEQAALFEKFSRLTYARERGIPGTGLGLAVCRQLVERMGGRIWLEDQVGPGACFAFEVPLDRQLTDPLPAPAAEETALPRTALVVEDLDYNARAMVAMLATLGCQAEAVSTAGAALRRIRQRRFDAIFIDCQLPDMTGPQLAAAIIAEQAGAPDLPPLIATTACADEATREACRRGGMEGFITKPVTPDKLRTALAGRDQAHLAASPMTMPTVAPGPGIRLDLRQLRILAPDGSALQEQAQRVGTLLQDDLHLLAESARRRDLSTMRASSHRIVSHARFIGASVLAAIADEIQRSDETHADLAVNLVDAVEREAERVLKELAAATALR